MQEKTLKAYANHGPTGNPVQDPRRRRRLISKSWRRRWHLNNVFPVLEDEAVAEVRRRVGPAHRLGRGASSRTRPDLHHPLSAHRRRLSAGTRDGGPSREPGRREGRSAADPLRDPRDRRLPGSPAVSWSSPASPATWPEKCSLRSTAWRSAACSTNFTLLGSARRNFGGVESPSSRGSTAQERAHTAWRGEYSER